MTARQMLIFLAGAFALSAVFAQPPPPPRPPAPPPGVAGSVPPAPPGYPIGQRLYQVPSGHQRVAYAGREYIFYDGHFYAGDNDEYVSIAPPLGAVVRQLPTEAERVGSLSQRVYRYRGVHYRRVSQGYQVVAAP